MPISGGGSPNTATTTISSAIARKLKNLRATFGQRPANGLDRPVDFRADHPHARPVGAIDQRVRADVVLDLHDVDLCGWLPSQSIGRVTWPDAPLGPIGQHHRVAAVMPLDLHSNLPLLLKEPTCPASSAAEFFDGPSDRPAPPP